LAEAARSVDEKRESTMCVVSRQEIIDYLEARHLPDGGYFFARVEPSSGLETYLAVKTFKLLGVDIKNAGSVVSFWKKQSAKGNVDSLFSAYLMIETFKELGFPFGSLEVNAQRVLGLVKELPPFRGSPAVHENIRLNNVAEAMNYAALIGRDLENLFHLATLAHDLNLAVDKNALSARVLSIWNEDGGFGGNNCSHPLSVYHALSILKALSLQIGDKQRISAYLKSRLDDFEYLENVFFVAESLCLLDEPLPDVWSIVRFIEGCSRKNGGFSRARAMGIPTIEHTFMAVSVLNICEKQTKRKYTK
jgi:hypothetical protein